MEKMNDIEILRRDIDKIDEEILDLLNKRIDIVLKIGKVKRDSNIKYYYPKREVEIIERLKKLNKGNFPNDALKIIFKEIFCASLSIEQPIAVAYLGPPATFTHMAAMKHFGSSCTFIPTNSINEVFEAVELNKATYGVVPIENSNEGIITYTIDMFMDYNLNIYAEIPHTISHHLLSKSKEGSEIKKIYSHPQPTAQCRIWLEKNMLGVPIVETASTAKAAELAAKEEHAAAIGSELAARIYELNFIERNIENYKDNVTKFLVISKTSYEDADSYRTSIMFSVKDAPGSLHEALTPFKKAKINLTRIESRPSKKKAWDYIFFVDMEGHSSEKRLKKALAELKKKCLYLKILGSYPQLER